MRKLRCRLCDEKWGGRRGPLHKWYEEHLRKHGLEEPKRQEGEDIDTYLDRLVEWRKQYFEDSLYSYFKSFRKLSGNEHNAESSRVSG